MSSRQAYESMQPLPEEEEAVRIIVAAEADWDERLDALKKVRHRREAIELGAMRVPSKVMSERRRYPRRHQRLFAFLLMGIAAVAFLMYLVTEVLR